MAKQELNGKSDDKCEHGNEPASCEECNPIFKDEVAMPGFHYVTVTGDWSGDVITTIEMQLAGAL